MAQRDRAFGVIYGIRFEEDKSIIQYVGQTWEGENFRKRCNAHRRKFRAYGKTAIFEILECNIPIDNISSKETEWIERLKPPLNIVRPLSHTHATIYLLQHRDQPSFAYIGQTVNLESRKSGHKSQKSRHAPLQEFFNQHGWDGAEWTVLWHGPYAQKDEMEKHFMNEYKKTHKMLNRINKHSTPEEALLARRHKNREADYRAMQNPDKKMRRREKQLAAYRRRKERKTICTSS